jgi:hypothetical protein
VPRQRVERVAGEVDPATHDPGVWAGCFGYSCIPVRNMDNY